MINKCKSKVAISSLVVGLGLTAGLLMNTQDTHASTVNQQESYIVKEGDCLWTIAQNHNMSLNELENLNNKNDNSLILPGEKLIVSDKGVYYTQEADNQSQTTQTQEQEPVTEQQPTSTQVSTSVDTSNAKEWIAQRESGGDYNAINPSSGTVGRYQLKPEYLHGDYSPANQERVADKYVTDRYGSWGAAQAFWQSHGWY